MELLSSDHLGVTRHAALAFRTCKAILTPDRTGVELLFPGHLGMTQHLISIVSTTVVLPVQRARRFDPGSNSSGIFISLTTLESSHGRGCTLWANGF